MPIFEREGIHLNIEAASEDFVETIQPAPTKICNPHRGDQIPIEPVAPPAPNFPRFPALALLGRLLSTPVWIRHPGVPETCTEAVLLTSLRLNPEADCRTAAAPDPIPREQFGCHAF